MTEMDERFICLVSLAARDLSGMIARLGHAAEKIEKKNWRKTYGMGKCDTCKEGRIMTKETFIEKVNLRLVSEGSPVLDVSDLDEDIFSVINTVYTFHPAIDDISGEDQIADLYVNYGISVIRDMFIRAEIMKELEKKYADMESVFRGLPQEMASIRRGDKLQLP